jgi:hypothetical protein
MTLISNNSHLPYQLVESFDSIVQEQEQECQAYSKRRHAYMMHSSPLGVQ